jgi:hypothetical protein
MNIQGHWGLSARLEVDRQVNKGFYPVLEPLHHLRFQAEGPFETQVNRPENLVKSVSGSRKLVESQIQPLVSNAETLWENPKKFSQSVPAFRYSGKMSAVDWMVGNFTGLMIDRKQVTLKNGDQAFELTYNLKRDPLASVVPKIAFEKTPALANLRNKFISDADFIRVRPAGSSPNRPPQWSLAVSKNYKGEITVNSYSEGQRQVDAFSKLNNYRALYDALNQLVQQVEQRVTVQPLRWEEVLDIQ